jgi:signal transduction histidine kinase
VSAPGQRQDDASQSPDEQSGLLAAYERIARAVLGSLELDEVLGMLVQEVVRAGLFRSMTIALVDWQRRSVDVMRGAMNTRLRDGAPVSESEITVRDEYAWASYPLDGENAMAAVARTGEMTLVESGADPRLDRRYDPNPATWGDKVAFFFPVKKGEEVLAVLATASTTARREETLGRIRSLQPLLSQVAVALEHARMYREARDMASRLRDANARLAEEMAERGRLEAELVRSQRMRAVADLAAGISHNLNNLLAAMLGSAQLVAASGRDPETKLNARELVATIGRARDLVDRFRVSTKSAREDPESVDVAAAVRDAVALSPSLAGMGGPQRSVTVSEDLSALPRVSARAQGLREILASLVSNALEAMPQGGTVNVDGRVEGTTVVIAVRDTGVGMDRDTLIRAFEPFFTTKPHVGRGLGLSVARSMVTAWGGLISLSSSAGQGTTAEVALPVWRAGLTAP